MMTSFKKVVATVYNRNGRVDQGQVNLACTILNKKGVVALPTDTLYGIAAKVDDNEALQRIYKIKGRDANKPLAVCLSHVDQIEQVAELGKLDRSIIPSLLPGPLTIVLKRSKSLNPNLNPGIDTIGVRVPDHNFIMAVADSVGPLALTSANRSGETSPIKAEEFKDIWDDLDLVFDTGSLREVLIEGDTHSSLDPRRGSTVIDLSAQDKRYTIIREGCSLNRTINTLQRFGYLRRKGS